MTQTHANRVDRSAQLAQRWNASMMGNYGTPPIALAAGRGVTVTDCDGNDYLDFVGGIAVSSLGHAHPAVVEAVAGQVGKLAHTSNLFMHEPGIRLAERLIDLVGQPHTRVFFANDGTSANECALKLARLHGRAKSPDGSRLRVVSTDNSFHGRTFGSLSITGTAAKREPFAPLPGPVTFVPHGDLAALRGAVDSTVSAVFLETTQGEAGVVPSPPGYLREARRLCDEAGALLIIDEVQSGIGRTGDWFASLAAGVVPDIITLAKGLGAGMPIGACLAIGPAADLFTPGLHGSTFGGNPVSCAAALAVLDTIESQNLLGNARDRGEQLSARITALAHPLVASVRGSGLWVGIVLRDVPASSVEAAAREHGLLVNAVKADVLRLAPPLTVLADEVDEAVRRLGAALDSVTT